MARKNYFHRYPANEFWSAFDPDWISGSISTGSLLHSLKQFRSFVAILLLADMIFAKKNNFAHALLVTNIMSEFVFPCTAAGAIRGHN